MGFNSAFKGLKLLKTPGNGSLNNLNDPVLNVLSNARIFINIGMRIIPLEATQSLITDFTILSIRIFPEIEILGFFFTVCFSKVSRAA